jgi:hypothetical protein
MILFLYVRLGALFLFIGLARVLCLNVALSEQTSGASAASRRVSEPTRHLNASSVASSTEANDDFVCLFWRQSIKKAKQSIIGRGFLFSYSYKIDLTLPQGEHH